MESIVSGKTLVQDGKEEVSEFTVIREKERSECDVGEEERETDRDRDQYILG